MAQNETSRLIQWLKEHGHDSDDIVDCLEFIASGRKTEEKDD